MIEKEVVLEVKNLKKYFPASHKRVLKAVDDVSFTIHKGETFGIVGESGCGKTTCGKTCTGILTKTDGQVLYQGKDYTEGADHFPGSVCFAGSTPESVSDRK